MNGFIIRLFFVSICFFACSVQAQDRSALENQRQSLLKEIEQTNQLLTENQSTTSSKLSDFKLLSTKVKKVSELVNSIQTEVNQLTTNIQKKEEEIASQEENLEQLRKSYSTSLVNTYKRNSVMNEMVFLLASDSFNSAFRRFNYLRKINDHRERQAESIKTIISTLEENKTQLLADKATKNALLAEQQKTKQSLAAVQATLTATLDGLQAEETELTKLLQKQEQEDERLQAEIRTVIAREIAAAKAAEEQRRREAEAAAAANTTTETETNTTENTTADNTAVVEDTKSYERAPEMARLSNSFATNKGSLPWPLESGIITSSLGEYGASGLPGIKQERDGIDIRTSSNSTVKTIFSGQVRSVTTIPGYNKVVIVSHGDYFSVYGKLGTVYVSAGDNVQTGDQLGVIENNAGVSELHLQIWNQQKRLDPKEWIIRK